MEEVWSDEEGHEAHKVPEVVGALASSARVRALPFASRFALTVPAMLPVFEAGPKSQKPKTELELKIDERHRWLSDKHSEGEALKLLIPPQRYRGGR